MTVYSRNNTRPLLLIKGSFDEVFIFLMLLLEPLSAPSETPGVATGGQVLHIEWIDRPIMYTIYGIMTILFRYLYTIMETCINLSP